MTDWCILRTAPSRTLPLAKSLLEVGIEAWTPIEVQEKRIGRKRIRKDRDVPMVPGIVFADYERLPRLVSISRSPGMIYQSWDAELRRMVARDHPPFSVFRYMDGYPCVTDKALDPLRLEERKTTPKAKVRTFRSGEEVRFPDAGFDGMTGIVQTSKGNWAMVLFEGFTIPVKIGTRKLLSA